MADVLKQPVVFLSHGGGPSFFLDAKVAPMMKGMDKNSKAAEFLRNFTTKVGIKTPKAVLVLSAHWATSSSQVSSSSSPELYYDYGGFPPETYNLNWPVPGAPDVARRVKNLLEQKGIPCQENSKRGLDHGVFVPLILVFPKAEIPVIQLSLLKNMKMSEHLLIAEALRELRNENILIIGSGFATHSGMQGLADWAEPFKGWLHDLLTNPSYTPDQRKERLLKYSEEKTFHMAHPRGNIEHFMPIAMTCAIGGYCPGTIVYSEFASGSLLLDHYVW